MVQARNEYKEEGYEADRQPGVLEHSKRTTHDSVLAARQR